MKATSRERGRSGAPSALALPATSSGVFVGFLLLTMCLGLTLRWEFVTGMMSSWGVSFVDLRHAHSHGGYYGALMLPWFFALRREGVSLSAVSLRGYAMTALAAAILFVPFGYNWMTITLSTLVLAGWLWAAGKRLHATGWVRGNGSWLDPTPWGVICGSVFIPAVAVLATRDPALSASLAHLFLGIFLFAVFMPTAYFFLGLRRRLPAVPYLASACLAAGAFSFPELFGYGGALFLFLHGWLIAAAVNDAPRWVRLPWLVAAAALALSGIFPLFQSYAARIAGIHFIILGPVLTAYILASVLRPAARHWLVYHAGLAGMLAAILFAGPVFGALGTTVVAVVSTVFVAAAVWLIWGGFRLRRLGSRGGLSSTSAYAEGRREPARA